MVESILSVDEDGKSVEGTWGKIVDSTEVDLLQIVRSFKIVRATLNAMESVTYCVATVR